MQETPVLVIIEVVSVQDPAGLKAYQKGASALIGQWGGAMLGHGGAPVDGELAFGPLAIQRWPSERAFRSSLASEAYQPLRHIRLASATLRVAIVPVPA